MKPRNSDRRLPAATILAVALLGLAALLMAGAGPAYRHDLLSLGHAFDMLRYGSYLALGTAGLGLAIALLALRRRRLPIALAGGLTVAIAVAMLSVPWLHWQRAQQVPAIHDITTDTLDPPPFEALAGAREQAPNAVSHPGDDTARQQREAYPEIRTLRVQVSMPEALEAVQAEILASGWELVSTTMAVDDSRSESRIEAIATTRWFGFRDDIAIRLRETEDGVLVDMRSASRVGRSDMGTNAARIRAFMEALETRLR